MLMRATKTFDPPDWQLLESARYHARQDARRPPRDPRNAVVARGSWGSQDDEPEPDEGKAVGA